MKSRAQPFVKRFFVFDTTNLTLSYYKDWKDVEKGDSERGVIRLNEVSTFAIPSNAEKVTDYGRYI